MPNFTKISVVKSEKKIAIVERITKKEFKVKYRFAEIPGKNLKDLS